MSLNPSNAIAQRTNPNKHVFRNLACNIERIAEDKRAELLARIDTQVLNELTEACALDHNAGVLDLRSLGSEVPTRYVGFAHGWSFHRAWYYYRAQGPGIPPDIAEEFHKEWGTQVRVEGHCGCPSPLEWCHGFAVGSYHIDTQEGLNAFVALIRKIYRP